MRYARLPRLPPGKEATPLRMNVSRTSRAASVARRSLPTADRPGRLLLAVDRLERTSLLDGPVRALRHWSRALPLGRGRDVLRGRWLGHPVHPLTVQLPIGAWLSSAVLDLVPGQRRAAGTLVAVGLFTSLPAALAGWTDWAELHPRQQRVGLAHAVANLTAVTCYGGSLAARLAGRRAAGRTLGLAGLLTVAAGGALGGHLAYRQASGVNHAEAVPYLTPPGWQPLGELTEFPVGEVVRRWLGDVSVMVVREPEGAVRVLADRCSHQGGPLFEGRLADGCVRCPWHGSVFRLSDGFNLHGPATAPQPVFDTRVVGGRVEACLRPGLRPAGRSGAPVTG